MRWIKIIKIQSAIINDREIVEKIEKTYSFPISELESIKLDYTEHRESNYPYKSTYNGVFSLCSNSSVIFEYAINTKEEIKNLKSIRDKIEKFVSNTNYLGEALEIIETDSILTITVVETYSLILNDYISKSINVT